MHLKAVKQSKSGILIDIEVVPGSKKEFLEYDEWTNRIKVKVKEPAVKGKANSGVVRTFSELFGNCEIVSGDLSRKKTVLVLNSTLKSVNEILTREMRR